MALVAATGRVESSRMTLVAAAAPSRSSQTAFWVVLYKAESLLAASLAGSGQDTSLYLANIGPVWNSARVHRQSPLP